MLYAKSRSLLFLHLPTVTLYGACFLYDLGGGGGGGGGGGEGGEGGGGGEGGVVRGAHLSN